MQKNIRAVYTIVEDERLNRAVFRRVGTAFVNRDDTMNVVLDALPVSGRLHIRDLEPRALGHPSMREPKAVAP